MGFFIKTLHKISSKNIRAFSLFEVILVLVLTGIIVGISSRTLASMDDAEKFKDTLNRLEQLRIKMTGNPLVLQSGHRVDFGYYGRNGTFPTSLDDLVSQYYIIHPNSEIHNKDAWGVALRYTLNANTAVLESYAADGANNGTGVDEDIQITIDKSRFIANTIMVYCTDRDGMALTDAAVGGPISAVAVISYGTTTSLSYHGQGYWYGEVSAGPCIIQASTVFADANTLMGKNSGNLTMYAVVYPKASFAKNDESVFEFRFPGAL